MYAKVVSHVQNAAPGLAAGFVHQRGPAEYALALSSYFDNSWSSGQCLLSFDAGMSISIHPREYNGRPPGSTEELRGRIHDGWL